MSIWYEASGWRYTPMFKPTNGWGLAHISGNWIIFIVSATRRQLIQEVERNYGEPWSKLRGYGYRAIKVTIAERS